MPLQQGINLALDRILKQAVEEPEQFVKRPILHKLDIPDFKIKPPSELPPPSQPQVQLRNINIPKEFLVPAGAKREAPLKPPPSEEFLEAGKEWEEPPVSPQPATKFSGNSNYFYLTMFFR